MAKIGTLPTNTPATLENGESFSSDELYANNVIENVGAGFSDGEYGVNVGNDYYNLGVNYSDQESGGIGVDFEWNFNGSSNKKLSVRDAHNKFSNRLGALGANQGLNQEGLNAQVGAAVMTAINDIETARNNQGKGITENDAEKLIGALELTGIADRITTAETLRAHIQEQIDD